MFTYCGNNPINYIDPTGNIGTFALVGIVVAAIIGGVASAAGTAASGGSTGEIVLSFVVGAVATAAIGTVAATEGIALCAVVGYSILISLLAEAISQLITVAFNLDDEYDPITGLADFVWAAGMGAWGGYSSYYLNILFGEIDELIGPFVTGVTSSGTAGVDFGARQAISNSGNNTSATSKEQPSPLGSGSGNVRHNRYTNHFYVIAL